MPSWAAIALLGVLAWVAVSLLLSLALSRLLRVSRQPVGDPESVAHDAREAGKAAASKSSAPVVRRPAVRAVDQTYLGDRGWLRVLVVDDDAPLRLLLRTTLGTGRFAVRDVPSAEDAAEVVRVWSPTVVILDIGLVGMDGLTFSRVLKDRARPPFVILLTGGEVTAEAAMRAGADAVLRKPFSPFDLMALLESVRASDSGAPQAPVLTEPAPREAEQLLAYARDLGRFVEVEHEQRQLLQNAYRETATALADALEARDPSTGRHALRVQQYAIELTTAVDEYLLEDGTLEYGYLLHDVGKIGVPDAILQKVGPLDDAERRIIEQHTVIGGTILSPIPFLRGAAVGLVRSHHERWDGSGYPDGLEAMKIPLSARIFAVVDALDAMTTDRPYRRALPWDVAVREILAQSGRQFDPMVVAVFEAMEKRLRRISQELAERAA